MLRLGTLKASCLTSCPLSPSTASESPLRTDTDTGTSLSFSSCRVAVTTTSARVSEAEAPAPDVSAAYPAIGVRPAAAAAPIRPRQCDRTRDHCDILCTDDRELQFVVFIPFPPKA